MAIKIDTGVTFDFPDGRTATLDTRELSKLRDRLHDEKGKGENKVIEREEEYIPDVKAFVREKAKIEISDSEACAIFAHANSVWLEKKVSWHARTETLPTSPNSTDLRSLD